MRWSELQDGQPGLAALGHRTESGRRPTRSSTSAKVIRIRLPVLLARSSRNGPYLPHPALAAHGRVIAGPGTARTGWRRGRADGRTHQAPPGHRRLSCSHL